MKLHVISAETFDRVRIGDVLPLDLPFMANVAIGDQIECVRSGGNGRFRATVVKITCHESSRGVRRRDVLVERGPSEAHGLVMHGRT